jgi:hypothetical protein
VTGVVQWYARRDWRYQRCNQNLQIEGQKTQRQKEKGQNDKQWSTNHIHKTKDRVTRTLLKTGGELRCSGRISSSCSTSGTRRVNIVTNPLIKHFGWNILLFSFSVVAMLCVSISLVDLLDELPSIIIYAYPISDADLNQGKVSLEFITGKHDTWRRNCEMKKAIVMKFLTLILTSCIFFSSTSICIKITLSTIHDHGRILYTVKPCVVCSSIYGFWLPLWYHQTLLTRSPLGQIISGLLRQVTS